MLQFSKKIIPAYTFDDVLLTPSKSDIYSRKDGSISLETFFSRRIKLRNPIVSANMDTVTESKMAQFMAESGGIGIIHRYLTIERQAEEVRKVKRAESTIIDDPYTISVNSSAQMAADLMEIKNVSGLIVLDVEKKIAGIITNRDLRSADTLDVPITEVMTEKVITAQRGISMQDAKKILRKNHIEKLPLLDSSGLLCGLITLRDILKQSRGVSAAKDSKGRLLVGAAVGVKDTEKRARALIDAGVDVLVVDIAHGHNQRAIEAVASLKNKFREIDIVGGNVATPGGVADMIHAGADAVKIGVGPGASCTTRIVAGVGVPQISAILECFEVSQLFKIPIIADGGINFSGDVGKALAAGASSVMIGSLFAGTDESPGKREFENGKTFKVYRGMASREASEDKARIDKEEGSDDRTPEGKSGRVPYIGSAKVVLDDLLGGLLSSMSYLGAKNLTKFEENALFRLQTSAGIRESNTRLDKI